MATNFEDSSIFGDVLVIDTSSLYATQIIIDNLSEPVIMNGLFLTVLLIIVASMVPTCNAAYLRSCPNRALEKELGLTPSPEEEDPTCSIGEGGFLGPDSVKVENLNGVKDAHVSARDSAADVKHRF